MEELTVLEIVTGAAKSDAIDMSLSILFILIFPSFIVCEVMIGQNNKNVKRQAVIHSFANRLGDRASASYF